MIYHLGKNEIVHELTGHTDAVNAVAFGANDSSLFTSSNDLQISEWNTEAARIVRYIACVCVGGVFVCVCVCVCVCAPEECFGVAATEKQNNEGDRRGW